MGVAAGVFQQQRVADVVQRRPVLMGRQRPKRGAGQMVKSHAKLSGAGVGGNLRGTLSRWKSYTNDRHLPNVTAVTERAPFFLFNGPANYQLKIKFSYGNNNLI